MSMKFYQVTLEGPTGERTLTVPSPTDVQAADAAAPEMRAGEAIVSITRAPDDGLQHADALPPKSQADELAPVTPGAASTES